MNQTSTQANESLTQQQKILNHLQSNPITGLIAWEQYGVYRLSEMIRRIREQGKKEGFTVTTEMMQTDGHTFAKYSLVKTELAKQREELTTT